MGENFQFRYSPTTNSLNFNSANYKIFKSLAYITEIQFLHIFNTLFNLTFLGKVAKLSLCTFTFVGYYGAS